MSNLTLDEIKREFLKSRIGIAGICILTTPIVISIIAMIIIPLETFQEWNNPTSWISYPKVAIPVWVNLFLTEKIPEHRILEKSIIQTNTQGEVFLTSNQFKFDFNYDDFPSDFIYEFSSEYSGTPLLQMSVIRPDGLELELVSTPLPFVQTINTHSERIFSTDALIKKKFSVEI